MILAVPISILIIKEIERVKDKVLALCFTYANLVQFTV